MSKRNNKTEQSSQNRPILLRCITLGTAFAVFAGVLGFQLSRLQIDEADEWRARALGQQLNNIEVKPARGTIYDANMKTLAVSNTVWTIDAAPDVMAQSKLEGSAADEEPARVASRELARILELDEAELYEKLSQTEKKYAAIKAKVDKPIADEVREMCKTYGLNGVYYRQDSKRYYPYESLAATVLGFTDTDGNGIEGLESWYNEDLAGTPGRTVAVRNAWGGEIGTGEDATDYPAADGYSLVTTIDTEIQAVLEKYLSGAVAEHNAHERGMGVVLDVNTFEILAMATSPAYDPNDPYEIYDEAKREEVEGIADPEEKSKLQGEYRTLQWRNKALADTYEPGSVFKVVTSAAALDSGTYTQESGFQCPSSIAVNDRTFSCAQHKAHGSLSLRQALIESCNVSFIKAADGMGLHTWYNYLNAFGMTEPTGVDLPGEPSQQSIQRLVYNEDKMGPVELASCSFGQSNKYTALQMVSAVAAAVNGGNLMQPHIVKQILDADGNVVKNIEPTVKRQVISPETSAILRSAMEEMVSTTQYGRNAYVAGYHVGGKSGTSQKLEVLTQENREVYISSMVAFAPADNPQVAVLIALDEPEDSSGLGTYFGGRLAGPAAGNIIKETLEILGVEPEMETEEDAARQTISCPNVTGKTLSDAQVALNQLGLAPEILGEGKTVVAQSPAANTQVPNGGQVVLYTESDAAQQMVTVPDFTGKTAKAAADEAKGMGLNVLTTGAPDNASSVQVQSQDVEAGTEVAKGIIITLTMMDTSNVADG